MARVMRSEGLRAKGKRAFVPRTTDSAHGQPVVANMLDRQFHAAIRLHRDSQKSPHLLGFLSLKEVGLEPTTYALKVRCSTN